MSLNSKLNSNFDSNFDSISIFYDGTCPLCRAEMDHLKNSDTDNRINLVNIHQDNFHKNYPDIDASAAMKILHGLYNNELLLGLAVTHRAWTLVGKGFWVAPLNWPVFKQIAHQVYLIIAKYRQPISTCLAKVFGINKQHCTKGTCYDNRTNTDSRRK
jgi:predicted DCC family thiol-disulfide oxidoreductase YuxK